MKRIDIIENHKNKLNEEYKKLIEQAYNFRQTDASLSDLSEYQAIKLLNKLNKLEYLYRAQPPSAN